MKRNIDILVEIQRRIYKFKFTSDDISVAIDVNDAELFDLIKDGDKRVIDIMNTIADIAQNLGLLTEDIKASMLNEGIDVGGKIFTTAEGIDMDEGDYNYLGETLSVSEYLEKYDELVREYCEPKEENNLEMGM